MMSLWSKVVYKVMFFTLAVEQLVTHYSEQGRFRFHCLGDGCPACAVGHRTTEHLYLPVWDLENRRIAIVYFHLGPDGPASPVLQFLKTYREQLADIAALIECEGQGKIHISARELLANTDRGAIECQEYCRGLKTGAINLRTCAMELSAEAIRALPEIKRKSVPIVGDVVLPSVVSSTAQEG